MFTPSRSRAKVVEQSRPDPALPAPWTSERRYITVGRDVIDAMAAGPFAPWRAEFERQLLDHILSAIAAK